MALFILPTSGNCQDPVSSQGFLVNIGYSPAFSGLNQHVDFICNYRTQWPGLGNAFKTYKAGFDGISRNNSCFSFLATKDVLGNGIYSSYTFDFIYNYIIKMSSFSKMSFSLQSSINQNSLNDPGISDIPEWAGGYTNANGLNENHISPDFSVAAAYGIGELKIGLSAFHLFQPNSISNDEFSKKYRKYSLLVFYRKPVGRRFSKKEQSIGSMLSSDVQNNMAQFTYGLSYLYGIIEPGIWIRHQLFDFRNSTILKYNSSTIILSSKINYLNLYIVYSFDALLTNNYATFNKFGIHEVTLGYHIKYKEGRKNGKGTINCPY